MIGGYDDLRNEVCELLGCDVTPGDVDIAVKAIVHEDDLTATTALIELNVLAQSDTGRETLRAMLAHWIMHERDRVNGGCAAQAQQALTHLLAALGGERRQDMRSQDRRK